MYSTIWEQLLIPISQNGPADLKGQMDGWIAVLR